VKKLSWGEWFAIVALALVGVYGLIPLFFQARVGHRYGVIGLLKQQGLGFQMYAGDYDDRLPLRDTWMDAIFPYSKSERIYLDPSLTKDGEEPPDGKYGFAFFDPLAGIDTKRMLEPEAVPLVFQSRPVERNTSGGLELLPDPPRAQPGDKKGTNGVCFLDGHVKAFGADWPHGPIVMKVKE
jgi:prepilin-type processing-associated H-X9-DG protein